MEKYQKLPREKDLMNSNEIRVSSNGLIKSYLNDATELFKKNVPNITIKATGKAIARAVTAAEVIKRSIKGLHQITRVGSMPITDTYEPLEEGLDKVIHERIVSFIEITLSKESLDEKNPGYQPPLNEEQLKEFQAIDMNRGQIGGSGGRRGSRSGGMYRSGGRGNFRERGGRGYRGGGREVGGYSGGRGVGYGGERGTFVGFRDDYTIGFPGRGRGGFGGFRGYRKNYRGFRGGGGGGGGVYRGFRGDRGRGYRGSA